MSNTETQKRRNAKKQKDFDYRAVMKCFLLFCFSVFLLFNAACQTDRITTSDGWRMPPQPRAAPVTPASAKVDRMVFTVGSKPDDTNNNGFPDSIKVSVALFSSLYPTAVQEEGTFIFSLYPQGRSGGEAAKPLGVWRLSGESLVKAVARTFAGPSYLFQLSLLDVGGDRMPLDRADLTCRFEPADGSPPVNSDGVRTIQIGRRMSAQS